MNTPIICLVVAAAENGVIGRGGTLPWRIPSDLKLFKRLTLGRPVIMGRRTFQSIGRPLPGRDTIVVTRSTGFAADGVSVAPSLEAALALARAKAAEKGVDEVMVIGGSEIYAAAEPFADRIYLTRVHANPAGDALFADPDPARWQLSSSAPIPPAVGDDHRCTLLTYERRRP